MKKLMEVLFSSFPIAHVLPMKKMKTQGVKNKVLKPQGCVRYLTLIISIIQALSSDKGIGRVTVGNNLTPARPIFRATSLTAHVCSGWSLGPRPA